MHYFGMVYFNCPDIKLLWSNRKIKVQYEKLKWTFEMHVITRNMNQKIEELKFFFEEKLSTLNKKLGNVCSELF